MCNHHLSGLITLVQITGAHENENGDDKHPIFSKPITANRGWCHHTHNTHTNTHTHTHTHTHTPNTHTPNTHLLPHLPPTPTYFAIQHMCAHKNEHKPRKASLFPSPSQPAG